jgi:hypothetical protein
VHRIPIAGKQEGITGMTPIGKILPRKIESRNKPIESLNAPNTIEKKMVTSLTIREKMTTRTFRRETNVEFSQIIISR